MTVIARHELIPLTKGIHVSPAELNQPVWPPDVTRIAFTGPPLDAKSDLYVIDADGYNLINLTPDGRTFNIAPTWSPDGQSIAFVSANQRHVGGSNRKAYRIEQQHQELSVPRLGPPMGNKSRALLVG